MNEERNYKEIFRRAGERWLEGDPGALEEFERGIAVALAEGDLPAALSAHQKLLVWKPGDAVLHERVAQAIATARDRAEEKPSDSPGLENIPLFSGVPGEELVSLLTAIEPVRVKPGENIVEEGETGDSLFLIASGTVRVWTRGDDGEKIPLAALGASDFFGEISLLTGRPRTATVTALTEVELLRLDRETVAELRQKHPDIETSLSEFHRRRAERTVEAMIERMRARSS